MTEQTTRATPGKARKTAGFGFDAERSPHHFAVVFDRQGNAGIYERHEVQDAADGQAGRLGIGAPKAALTAYLWGRIAETAANDFNRRLRAEGARVGQWRGREVALAPHFGKELTGATSRAEAGSQSQVLRLTGHRFT